MTRVTVAEIEKRAKENCAADGKAWDVKMRQVRRAKKIPSIETLNVAEREKYLAKAKEQLLKERRG